MIRVGVVDNDPFTLRALTTLVEREPGFSVAVQVPSVAELLSRPLEALDVVLLDVLLGPGERLMDNLRALCGRDLRVLVITCEPDREEIVPALRLFPVSILDKGELTDGLHDTLRLVMSGKTVTTQGIQARLNATPAKPPQLTPRQLDVLRLRASGLPLRSVAERLHIGYKTAYDHYEQIRERLEAAGYPVDNDVELHYVAIRLGFIPDPRVT